MDRTYEQWCELIPEEFRQGDAHPCVCTVGQLIEQLQRLPSDLPLDVVGGSDSGVLMCVYNVCDDENLGPHLILEDNYSDEDDDDIANFWDSDDDDWMDGDSFDDDDDDDDDDDWDDDDEDW